MSKFFTKLFLKDSTDYSNPVVRNQYGKLAGIFGIATNLILFAIKGVAGQLSGSISIIADGVNNLSDSASSLVTLVCFKISGKPADAEHPYGHGRMEYIAGLIVSFIILFLGFQLIISSAKKIFSPEPSRFGIVALSLLAVTIPAKFIQSLYYKNIGKKIDSIALHSAAVDSRNDVISTLAVLIAAIITYFTGINLDGYMGVAVALFIIVSGIRLVIDTVDPLLGLKPKRELVSFIHNKVLSYESIIGIHDLHVHSYGPLQYFASLHCEVPAGQDIMVSHDIIDNIERNFLSEHGIHMVMHLDPVVTDDERTNQLRKTIEGLISDISSQISIHDFRAVWNISHVNILFDILVPYGFKWDDSELKDRIARKIISVDSSYYPVITIDHYG